MSNFDLEKLTSFVGEEIHVRRSRLRMSLATLAEKVDSSPNHLSDIERGKIQGLNLILIIKIARALDCKLSDFLPKELL